MGERLTYGILARYRVLVERLGGLFFAGRRSCTEDYSGLYCGDYLTVSVISCLCVILDTQLLNMQVQIKSVVLEIKMFLIHVLQKFSFL